MNNKAVIFVGPSLRRDKARRIFDADYRPPAKKGDLLRLVNFGFNSKNNNNNNSDNKIPTIVGLIDGLFLQDYPPTPIEVYHLLSSKYFRVVGGASLGALRAVELEKFGMVGIGKIFELYKKGIINADDEVAVTFAAEEDQEIQSEAMIDIRYNLFIANKRGIIDATAKTMITRVAKRIYFPYRNYSNIIEQTKNKFPELSSQLNLFAIYIEQNRKSLKELDALKVIKYIKAYFEDCKNTYINQHKPRNF
ncbi:MAG TPA: TfuA-like protein [Nitrososphaeraceae archaeon]